MVIWHNTKTDNKALHYKEKPGAAVLGNGMISLKLLIMGKSCSS